MPLHVESDSCDRTGVGIFSHRKFLVNVTFLCFTKKKKFYQHFLVTTFFHLVTGECFSLQTETYDCTDKCIVFFLTGKFNYS